MPNEDKNTIELTSDEFKKKAERILSIIENINYQGGITTQLMMAAACIEVYNYFNYLQNFSGTYSCEIEINRNTFLNCSEIDVYIRRFKNAQNILFSYLSDNPKQRIEDEKIISNLKEELWTNKNLSKYEDCDDYLDSWKGIRTDYEMLWNMLYEFIDYIPYGLEDIYQIVRKPTSVANSNSISKKRYKPQKFFREFIVDAERTNEIIEKLHRLIGNKTNTDALKIITRAMWIGWIERPTATSIKNEFPTIVCSCQMISKCLNEVKPTHPNNAIEKIRQDYERA